MTIQKYIANFYNSYSYPQTINSWQLSLLGSLLSQPSNCTKIWYFLILSCFSKLHFATHQLKEPEGHITVVKYKEL